MDSNQALNLLLSFLNAWLHRDTTRSALERIYIGKPLTKASLLDNKNLHELTNIQLYIGIWNYDAWDGNWYEYQNLEVGLMNSSVTPDKVREHHEFRDYLFASRAIKTLKAIVAENKYFMLSIGFKSPHLTLHVPYR